MKARNTWWKRLFLAGLGAAILLSTCQRSEERGDLQRITPSPTRRDTEGDTVKSRPETPRIAYLRIGKQEVRVEVSADPKRRERGLMDRTELAPDSGMIFLFPFATRQAFWMRNVPIALSIAFLRDSGEIADIQEMAPGAGIRPDALPQYVSSEPVRIALEMEGGWFAAHGVRVGDRAELGDLLREPIAR